MDDIIKLLPDAMANQIAAGEVIQRPASVVKELMENAIDAGAGKIQLILKDAGKQLIQVVDDGKGMSVTDARMSFERHATSKIRESGDLFQIKTMGFRGEALASIASVAQVELKTKRASDEIGTRILIEGSEVKSQEDVVTPVGTSISVKNLFYNVPARRKFLKKDPVEMRHILDEFQHVALAHPQIHFTLHHNDQEVFHLPPTNQRQRIVAVFGSNTNPKLVPVDENTADHLLTGFVGKPEFSRKTRGEQYFYVNQRFIRSGYLHHAISKAYEELISEDHHPLYVLFLEIDPARIDVNVHPTKHEIKFEDERLIYHFVKVAIRHALGRHGLIPALDFEADHSISQSKMGDPVDTRNREISRINPGSSRPTSEKMQDWQNLFTGLQKPLEEENPQSGFPNPDHLASSILVPSSEGTQHELEGMAEDRPGVRPYQIHQSYILSPIKSGFMLVDQQYAHERILYEEFMQKLEGQPARVQKELFPRTLTLGPADSALIESILPLLVHLGFDIAAFGEHTFIIHGVPADLPPRTDALELIRQMLHLHKEDLPIKPGNAATLAKNLAKNAAIKRGVTMDQPEMKNLIDRLFACEIPFKTPSGKLCFITYELEAIEKQFRG